MKKIITNPVLASWIDLNDHLKTSTEVDSEKLLKEELKGRKRKQFVLRIHSRINKLRADRERLQLISECLQK